jgi:hypothetical protein
MTLGGMAAAVGERGAGTRTREGVLVRGGGVVTVGV